GDLVERGDARAAGFGVRDRAKRWSIGEGHGDVHLLRGVGCQVEIPRERAGRIAECVFDLGAWRQLAANQGLQHAALLERRSAETSGRRQWYDAQATVGDDRI